MFGQIVNGLLLAPLLLFIGFSTCNPVPEDAKEDWSTRVSDNVESIINMDAPIRYNFDDSTEEVDSSVSKREASSASGPLDAPLVWGARIESSPSASPSSSAASVSASADVLPSSVTGTGSGAVVGGGGGVVGGDNKQKVDWALNPGDNRKVYSADVTPEVIEQKKEETVALAPESSKQSEEANNPDPYKDILPAVLTGKRRLVEGDKPVVSTAVTPDENSTPATVSVKESENVSSPALSPVSSSSNVDVKGHSGGQVVPSDQPSHLKSSEKTIPQHVYTEDQFPSVITIKGREYLVIPHKSNTVRPGVAQNSVASVYSSPDNNGFYVQSAVNSDGFVVSQPTSSPQSDSPFFSYHPVFQSTRVVGGTKSKQPFQTPISPHSGQDFGRQQFVSTFTRYPEQTSYDLNHQGIQQNAHPSGFAFSSRYPVYHSSVFTNPNVQQQSPVNGPSVENSVQSVFASFFPQYGPYPSQASSSGHKKYEFFTPPSHTVSVTPINHQGDGGNRVFVSSPPSFVTSSVASSTSGSNGSPKPGVVNVDSATIVSDPLFTPKLQDSVQSSPVDSVVSSQQEIFVSKPNKPESNLHAPPQIPFWSPFGFSVVAGSYPVQSPVSSVSVSSTSSSSSSSSTSTVTPSNSPTTSTFTKTNAGSPVTVTVDTKFPVQSSPSFASSSSTYGNNGVKGASPSKSSSPSVTVGSFSINSATDQPVKGQAHSPQQQQDQLGGDVAGEAPVPTTFVDNKHQLLPNNPYFTSSTGYFVAPVDSVYQSSFPPAKNPSEPYAQPMPQSHPSQISFTNQRQFFAPPWHSVYNYPLPVSSSGYFGVGSSSSAAFDVHPHYQYGQFSVKSQKLNRQGVKQ